MGKAQVLKKLRREAHYRASLPLDRRRLYKTFKRLYYMDPSSAAKLLVFSKGK